MKLKYLYLHYTDTRMESFTANPVGGGKFLMSSEMSPYELTKENKQKILDYFSIRLDQLFNDNIEIDDTTKTK